MTSYKSPSRRWGQNTGGWDRMCMLEERGQDDQL